MTNVGEIISRARAVLQDADRVRYSDAELVSLCSQAVSEIYRMRPDLFFRKSSPPVVEFGALTEPLPVPAMYDAAMVEYIVGFAELRDDQWATDGRAATLLQKFSQQLMIPMS